MPEEIKLVIDTDRILMGLGANREKTRVTVGIHSNSNAGNIAIEVWIPHRDSISDLRRDAIAAAMQIMQAAIKTIAEE